MIPDFLTVTECAEKLRCSAQHVRQLCRKGQVEAFRDGKQILISVESVLHHLDDRRLHGGPLLRDAKGRTK